MKRNNPDMSTRRGQFRDDWSKAAKYIQQAMLLFNYIYFSQHNNN